MISFLVLFLLFGPGLSIITVRTYVCMQCPGCVEWNGMIDSITDEFPSINFDTIYLTSGKDVLTFPTTETEDGHRFNYPKRVDFLRRWLHDLENGQLTLVLLSPRGNWSDRFSTSLHVLSREYPPKLNKISRQLLGTGIGWTRTETNFLNTVIVKRIDGTILMVHNISLTSAVQKLFPSVVPLSLANTSNGLEILNFFKYQAGVVSPLPLNWSRVTSHETAWIQWEGNERSDVFAGTVFTQRRSVEYLYDGLDLSGVESWYGGIDAGVTLPHFRPSVESELESDVSGDALSALVISESLVYLYNDDSSFSECSAQLSAVTAMPVYSFDIGKNDHESLPMTAVSGSVHYYNNGSVIHSVRCVNAGGLLKYIDSEKSKDEL